MVIKRFQTRLFLIYFAIVLFVIASLSSVFYLVLSDRLRDNSLQSLRRQTLNISNETEKLIRDMDRISVYIATSRDLKIPIDKHENDALDSGSKTKIENTISDFLSPWFTIRQVNLFNDRYFLSFGVNDYGKFAEEYKHSSDLIQRVLELNGGKYLREAQVFQWSYDDESLFSLCRSFRTENSIMIVEVQQQYEKLKTIVADSSMEDANEVYIFTDDDRLLYPIDAAQASVDFYEHITCTGEQSVVNARNPVLDENETLFVEHSNYMGLRIIVAASEDELYAPVHELTYYTLLIVLIILIATFTISLRVAKVITVPIDKMKSIANGLDIGNLKNSLADKDPGVGELKQLFHAFERMQSRLDESIGNLIESKEQENRANMIAFQSQINPHFLYNTLTVIGAKGYENDLPVIEEMCSDLSYILRYLTNDQSSTGSIAQEIEYSVRYLNLLKKRYEDKLNYQIRIDPSMDSIRVPKLIFQPIIENCIMHGFGENSISIDIDGVIEDGKWKIAINDNGKGISEADLASIHMKLSKIRRGMKLSEITTDKIGLLNTYIRLYLFTTSEIIFEIRSGKNGTSITIGGIIDV